MCGACELPRGKQALPSHIVFEGKRDGRYKARWVAGGHKQVHGLDFGETYEPVCSYRTLRMVLAVAAHEDLELRQFDVRTAFLNGKLEEEVYLRPPRGAEHFLNVASGEVLRLYKALYGLRQAGRAWNKCLEEQLRQKGFRQSNADPSLWIVSGESGETLVMFYVDDGLVAARSAADADAVVRLVASLFEIREIGEPQDFLGIRITGRPGASKWTRKTRRGRWRQPPASAGRLAVCRCRRRPTRRCRRPKTETSWQTRRSTSRTSAASCTSPCARAQTSRSLWAHSLRSGPS